MALIGYARVSTAEQDTALQTDALRNAGCERVFEDTASGAKADRPGLADALAYLRDGDVLVVWRLDRLGRSLPHLIETVGKLEARGVGFRSLTENIDTTTPGGRLIFHVFGALGQFERDLIRERRLDALCPVLLSPAQGLVDPTALAEWILEDGLDVGVMAIDAQDVLGHTVEPHAKLVPIRRVSADGRMRDVTKQVRWSLRRDSGDAHGGRQLAEAVAHGFIALSAAGARVRVRADSFGVIRRRALNPARGGTSPSKYPGST